MDKADFTAIRRRVGRMTEEQVRPLFEEARSQRNARRNCPDCHYISGQNWHHCDEFEALYEANRGRILEILKQLRDHEEDCPNCYITSYWKEFSSSCEKCGELQTLISIYAQHLDHLRYKEKVRQFEQENGRKPSSPLELAVWEDAHI